MPPEPATNVTRTNGDTTQGGRGPLDALLAAMYDDLRAMARRYMQAERRDHTLQPTALVHEAYFRLAGQTQAAWKDRAQVFAVASEMMRRILVDHARAHAADKRGGGRERITIGDIDQSAPQAEVDLLALDDALHRLAAISAEQARIVELRFFGGLTIEEVAAVTATPKRSVDREWACAKAWLYRELGG
jgi:RNA polymerase sigma-70 factor, ECF subfamily